MVEADQMAAAMEDSILFCSESKRIVLKNGELSPVQSRTASINQRAHTNSGHSQSTGLKWEMNSFRYEEKSERLAALKERVVFLPSTSVNNAHFVSEAFVSVQKVLVE